MAKRPPLRCWWNGLHVADFEQTAKNGARLRCRYTAEALNRFAGNAPLLSCSLPVGSKPMDATNFLHGLLPEGQALDALARRAKAATYDTYALLAAAGRDCAGALIITADAEPPEARPGRVEPYDDSTFTAEVDELEDNPLGLHDDSELSIAGLQNKLLLVDLGDGWWGRPVHGYPSTHILKAEDLRHPGLVRAEAASLTLAHDVGLTAARPQVVTANGRDCIIIVRYDRNVIDGVVHRVHQEDACQALDIDADQFGRKGKYERNGGPSLRQVADLLDRYADNRTHELHTLVRQLTYTTVVGNADWHGKNLSVLHDMEGRIRLAPLYDTVPTRFFPQIKAQGAVNVAGEFNVDRITVDQIAKEATTWGLPLSDARDIATSTVEALREAAPSRPLIADYIVARAEHLLNGPAPVAIAMDRAATRAANQSPTPTCEGVYSDGRKCRNQPLPDSRFCGRKHGRSD